MASRGASPTTGGTALAAMLAVACAGLTVPAGAASRTFEAAGPSEPWFEVTVPGGTAGLARAAGLDPAIEAWRLLPDLTRRLHVSFGERAAARAQPRVAAFLADGGGSGDRLPVPLSPALWGAILGPGKDGHPRDVLTAITTDGGAARLYRGLCTMDAPTLAALAAAPEDLRQIYRRHSDAFGTFASSFRVETGRVAVPGGYPESALWQDLVGVSVMQPGRFLRQLVSAEEGRLLFFYDAVDRLDEAHRRFALDASEPDAERRQERVRALRAVFSVGLPWWEASQLPLSRPVADPPRVLEAARVTADGALAPPDRQLLWTAAFEDQVDAPAEWRARLAESPAVDAAWLVQHVAVADSNVARNRLGMLAFAQRALARPAEADPADVLAALRGFGRYRTLALALERMGIRDPADQAAAARHAEQLDRAGSGARARVSLAEFQGAVTLVERASVAGTIDSEAAARLVRALVALKLDEGRYGDRLAGWARQDLLPAFRARVGAPAATSAEDVVLRAMAGYAEGVKPPRLDWEGLTYDVDPPATEYRRLVAIRRRQAGASLDAALAASGADIEARLAAVLVDLAYAAALGPAETAPAASEDVAHRHEFGFGEPEALGGPRAAWSLPREAAGPSQRWHAQGSLLGLDVALARLALRRLETDAPPMPLLSAADRRGFAENAVLLRAFPLDDQGRDRIAETLRRGRARLAAAVTDPGLLPRVVADVGLRDWRRGTLPWIASHDGAHLESAFTLAEILRLGETPLESAGDAADVAAWGTSARWEDGCLCLRRPRPARLDALAGRAADGRMAALAPDLHLRVAELMAEMGLPSQLAPAILSLATLDLMDGAEPGYVDDALAVSRFARALTRTRMEDYVASLAGSGPLVPAGPP